MLTIIGHDEQHLTENLRIALSSRATIDQAIGIMMARQRCSPEEAFATLRTISQHRNVKLRHVVTNIINATQQPQPATQHTTPPHRPTQ